MTVDKEIEKVLNNFEKNILYKALTRVEKLGASEDFTKAVRAVDPTIIVRGDISTGKSKALQTILALIDQQVREAKIQQLLDLMPYKDTVWAGETPEQAAAFVDRYYRALIKDYLDQLNYDPMTFTIRWERD